MKMTYYKNKKTGEVFAYDDSQLSQVARLTELEVLVKDTEPKFINASNNLQQAEIELKTAHEKLADAIKNEDKESSILALEANANEAAEKRNKASVEFDIAVTKYRPIKEEYDAIPLGFFDIRENISITQKMTTKEVEAHINPPVSKEKLISDAEIRKQLLADDAEKNITILERKVRLNMATDDDKNNLTAWEIYSINVADIDTSTAPDITWPVKP
ncbi:TPA: tail fiber assembly protein [Providencia alcalifaciens]|nr:tail fiber assembly protein [Providencia alcalifaciens]